MLGVASILKVRVNETATSDNGADYVARSRPDKARVHLRTFRARDDMVLRDKTLNSARQDANTNSETALTNQFDKMNEQALTFLEIATAEEVGLDPQLWKAVLRHSSELVSARQIPALAIQVQRSGLTTGSVLFGSRSLERYEPLDQQSRFLIASITKPIVAMAVLLLAERGALALNQRVSELVPEFQGPNKRQITIKQLLTHTSGLPDMLADNRELRAANASLMDFVKATGTTELVFPSATNAQYQSMGFALLGPLIENASGIPFQQFMHQELFQKLGMERAVLGMSDEELDDRNFVESRVPEDQVGETEWNWNSRYWKTFGAPWGGILATAEDVSRFCRSMLSDGRGPDGSRIFHPETIRMATTNRLNDFPDIPENIRRTRGWGYGWRMNWMDHRGSFGDLLGPDVYGHWGATGTVCWLDQKTETAVVVLSSQPYNRSVSPLVLISNMISAAFRG